MWPPIVIIFKAYDDLIEEFMTSVKQAYGEKVLVQVSIFQQSQGCR